MAIEIRPGDYRICPSCGARHKVQDLRCAQCDAVLAGTPVRHAAPAPTATAASRSGRSGLRVVLAAAVLIALGAGFLVRSLFRGAQVQQSVQAATPVAAAASPAPPQSWTPPVLNYPPVVGYNTGVPASMAALAIQAAPAASAVTATSAAGGPRA